MDAALACVENALPKRVNAFLKQGRELIEEAAQKQRQNTKEINHD